MNDYIDKKIFENDLLESGERNYKIFNKIKKIFILGILLFVGFISFGNCELITYPNIEGTYTIPTTARNRDVITDGQNVCVYGVLFNVLGVYDGQPQNGGTYITTLDEGSIYCSTDDYWIRNNGSINLTVLYGTKPIISSLDCQTEYNLIPISSVDQNYCVNNGFCPSGGGDCPICPGSGDNWSALYINDIQHLGKPIINITFPDYLDWDYTTTENEFNLDIVGYPVDTEYIDGIIRTQNYKPTSEDFTQLVGMLAPYSKYLLFLLFVFIIWAWIKKPFKSKKL